MDLAFKGSELNHDQIAAIGELYERAKAGDITGISYSVETKGHEVEMGFAGSMLHQPFRTLGVVGLMYVEFSEVVRRKLRVIK